MAQTKEKSPGCKNKITHHSKPGRPDISDMNNKENTNTTTQNLLLTNSNGQSTEIGEKVMHI